MRRRIWIVLVLILATLISAVWFFTGYVEPPSEGGFRLVFLENNVLLISDADVVSYNLRARARRLLSRTQRLRGLWAWEIACTVLPVS